MIKSHRKINIILIYLFVIQATFYGLVLADVWTQTSQSDFDAGTKVNVDIISDPGNITLPRIWIKNLTNPVLDLGPPGSWEDYFVWAPRVLYDGTTYHMWYSGDDGTTGRIGYASSFDGISWIKYSGNPILDRGSLGSWEEQSVYVPTIHYDGVTYHMWYTGYDYSNTYRIGYAYSSDGFIWTKYSGNPILDIGSPGSWDDYRVHANSVLFIGTTYHMWYSASDGSTQRIGYATSPDGITWTKHSANPILSPGPPGSWDDVHVYYPTVHHDGTGFHMWYIGHDGVTLRIGYASSPDGITWTKSAENPVLEPGPVGTWDDNYLYIPNVLYDGLKFNMWYTGHDGSNFRIGHASLCYLLSGNLTSSVFDSGSIGTSWNFINWIEYLPLGTNITMATRSGDTSIPDASWSSWSVEMWDETGSAITSPNSRYIQYRATLSTTDQYVTPVLCEVNINYTLKSEPPPDQPPIANAGLNQVVYEGDVVQLNGSASYDPDGNITNYEWDFDANDGLWWDTGGTPEAMGPITTHTYGDNGDFIVTLRVTDDQNLTDTDTCNITVLNVDPTVTIESVTMNVEISLRVAGSKWSNVGLTLYENDTAVGNLEVERWPGNPYDNPTYENPALPTTLDMTKTYKAIVTYDPYPDNGDEIKGDQPNNGKDKQNNAGNPVWIIMKFSDGSEEKIHHTFNTQQSKKRNSEHWNHVEPWEVNLNGHLVGHEFEVMSHITDPGSDDEALTYTYDSQVVTFTYLNNPPDPDPFPSPEVNPMNIMDTTKLTYEGPGTLSLLVEDDDGGKTIKCLELG
jgi:predicted GH43/DUF377 family glycosyl hydrolase